MAVDKKKLKLVFEFLGQIICIEKMFFSVTLWVGLTAPFLTITQIFRAILYMFITDSSRGAIRSHFEYQ